MNSGAKPWNKRLYGQEGNCTWGAYDSVWRLKLVDNSRLLCNQIQWMKIKIETNP